jgi:hypothetical protein
MDDFFAINVPDLLRWGSLKSRKLCNPGAYLTPVGNIDDYYENFDWIKGREDDKTLDVGSPPGFDLEDRLPFKGFCAVSNPIF